MTDDSTKPSSIRAENTQPPRTPSSTARRSVGPLRSDSASTTAKVASVPTKACESRSVVSMARWYVGATSSSDARAANSSAEMRFARRYWPTVMAAPSSTPESHGTPRRRNGAR